MAGSRAAESPEGAVADGPGSAEPAARRARRLPHAPARAVKFRQAAFVYLHVGLLYEAAVIAAARAGVLPAERGAVWVWLLLGAAIVAVVFWGLWRWQNPWFARAVWLLHALRLPALVRRGFLPVAEARLPAALYVTAVVVVLINLWMLARAGWDL
ncbi:MAG: hypothetical protein ACE5JR_02210 [Gemmatimonadota bacterium]